MGERRKGGGGGKRGGGGGGGRVGRFEGLAESWRDGMTRFRLGFLGGGGGGRRGLAKLGV